MRAPNISCLSILAASTAVLLLCCANPIPPGGGAKDIQAPQIVTEESTENEQTGFDARSIEITFDEWIELRNQATQIVISPPLNQTPEISVKSKTVVVKFHEDEVLQENTTYTLNFGESVRDITEGNTVENLMFVFSTGTFIDSLELTGTVRNVTTGLPAAKALVILQANLSDTSIVTLNPSYFAQADDEGHFKLRYLREDTFRIFALQDLNANYKFDQAEEWIGFRDDLVYVRPGGQDRIELQVFQNDLQRFIIDKDDPQPGVINVVFNTSAELAASRIIGDQRLLYEQAVHDTLKLWHQFLDTAQIEILYDDVILDTIRGLPYVAASSKLRADRLGRGPLHPMDSLLFFFSTPVTSVDATKVRIKLNDTIDVAGCLLSTLPERRLSAALVCDWQEGGKYQVELLPGGVIDIFGNTNDTTSFRLVIGSAKDYGMIKLDVSQLDSASAFILELREGEKLVTRHVLPIGRDVQILNLAKLPAASYVLRIVQDANGNGRWDTGDYQSGRQPEAVHFQALEALRAGWDLDIKVNWPK